MSTRFLPLTILVIEDERLLRWALSESLGAAGHSVIEATDETTGLRAVRTSARPFDVIFLNFRLPEPNDLALCAAIRVSSPGSVVVLMSASATPEMVSAAYQLGAYRVINKPFDLVEMHTLVASVAAASQGSGGDCHGSDRHERVPVSVSMDRSRYGTAPGKMALRDLHTQL